jgi:hypothetical protein
MRNLFIKYIFTLVFCLPNAFLLAQSTFIGTNEAYQQLVERYEIKQGKFADGLFTTLKPYSRRGVAQLADSVLAKEKNLSQADLFNMYYFLNDNSEWADSLDNNSRKPILKYFYRNKTDFYHVDNKEVNLHINPILYVGLGRENSISTQADNGMNMLNTRGVEVRGIIGKRLGFYTSFTENQMNFPWYVRQRTAETNAVPNEGFWKTLDAAGAAKNKEVDFLNARGYITFNAIKQISVQFGHDRHFWGNGHRSLMLSDFSAPYLFLKINTKIGRFNYTNLFTQMTANVLAANQEFPKKYATFHHLSINIAKNFNVGLFEGVVFSRQDSLARNNQFELGYLNPIILYRFLEQQFGTIDNAMVGVDFKWNIKKKVQVYGQIMLDEFVLNEVRSGNGWWSNKQSLQFGAKYIEVAGIKNLDLQAEVNYVRPFTYGHESLYTNYMHFRQPLAHPLGANFTEFIGVLRYQPLPRLQLVGKVMYASKGEDKDNQNYGGNPLQPSKTRIQDYDNRTGQGAATKILYADFMVSYQLKHNLFIDLKQIIRQTDSELPNLNYSHNSTFLAIRLNIAQRNYEF